MFVSQHDCVFVYVFEPGQPQTEGSGEGTLGETWVGTTDYMFSHPLGSLSDYSTEYNCENAFKFMPDGSTPFDNLD